MSLAFLYHLPQHTAFAVLQPLLAESKEQMEETIALRVWLRKDKKIRSLKPESNLVILLRCLVCSCGICSRIKSPSTFGQQGQMLGMCQFLCSWELHFPLLELSGRGEIQKNPSPSPILSWLQTRWELTGITEDILLDGATWAMSLLISQKLEKRKRDERELQG